LFFHPAAAAATAPIPTTRKNTTRPQEDIIIITQSKPFSKVPSPHPPPKKKKRRETETETERNNRKERQSVRGRKKTQKQRKKRRSSRCTAIPKKASKARRCLSVERKPGNVQQRQKEEEKNTHPLKKGDILGFGFFFFFFFGLSLPKKNTLRSQYLLATLFLLGETSSKSEIRNSAKKSFWRFSVARSEGEKKNTKKNGRCKNRHIHVISFHSVAKNTEV
jgi:hypothetical protein